MSAYSRPQLWVLLAITALGGLGIAVGGWRRAHPEIAERIEQFDGEAPTEASARTGLAPAAGDRSPRAGTPAGVTPRASSPRSPRIDRAAATRPHAVPSRSPDVSRPGKRRASEGPLDLNHATIQDLKRLPGVGPGLAQRIIDTREHAGHFASVDDLRAVPGVGAGKFARLRDLVTVSK